jgi:hypothetical protein
MANPSKISRSTRSRSKLRSQKFRDVLAMAEREGLLAGGRSTIIRGRMPEALVAEARKRTGIRSETALIELALANIAVADEYADWLLSRRGTIDPEIDLEF